MELIIKYQSAWLGGLMITLLISSTAWFIGIVTGFIIGFTATRLRQLSITLSIISFSLSAIPAIAFLYWAHYPLQSILGININPLFTTIWVLTTLNALAIAELVRSSIQRISKEFVEAAFVHNMSRQQATLKVELPLVIRHISSPLIGQQVIILHLTLFASLISVNELFRVAQRINSIEFDPVGIYTAVALIYFAISAPLMLLSRWLNMRFGRDFSER